MKRDLIHYIDWLLICFSLLMSSTFYWGRVFGPRFFPLVPSLANLPFEYVPGAIYPGSYSDARPEFFLSLWLFYPGIRLLIFLKRTVVRESKQSREPDRESFKAG